MNAHNIEFVGVSPMQVHANRGSKHQNPDDVIASKIPGKLNYII